MVKILVWIIIIFIVVRMARVVFGPTRKPQRRHFGGFGPFGQPPRHEPPHQQEPPPPKKDPQANRYDGGDYIDYKEVK